MLEAGRRPEVSAAVAVERQHRPGRDRPLRRRGPPPRIGRRQHPRRVEALHTVRRHRPGHHRLEAGRQRRHQVTPGRRGRPLALTVDLSLQPPKRALVRGGQAVERQHHPIQCRRITHGYIPLSATSSRTASVQSPPSPDRTTRTARPTRPRRRSSTRPDATPAPSPCSARVIGPRIFDRAAG